MTSLTAIPLSDIKFFLTLNEQFIPVKIDDIYSASWSLIKSGNVTSAPPSVTDWIISYNLLSQNINIPSYKTSEILLSPDEDLKDLANLLTLPNVDKERIIRILGYLNVLNNDIDIFEVLPKEILINIITKLDCKSILLICKSSSKFNKFCELNLDELLKQKLHKETKFITDTYNREELIGLCRLHSTKHISAGFIHSLILKDNGEVYSFGNNSYGQLGLALDDDNVYEPTLILEMPKNIKYISAGTNISLVLNENGQVYSWGLNEHGQLGLGDIIEQHKPALVLKMPADTIQISIGDYHSLSLNINNKVYSWGYNEYGQLGLGPYDEISIPTLVLEMPNNIVQISIGEFHTLALSNDGHIYSFGNNRYGQLGLGDYDNRNIPTLVPKAPNNIIQIVAGTSHSLCLTNDGYIYSFGKNNEGQLGLGNNVDRNIPTLIPNLNNIIQISGNSESTLALSNTGKIYAFGYNNEGQLGLGDYENRIRPTLVLKIPNNIIQISTGHWYSLVLMADGRIYAFGKNFNGQLGFRDDTDINIPTLIPNFNVLS